MKYSIQNNGSGFCLFRVLCPESLAASFLAFIEQKSRENVPVIRSVSSVKDESYLIRLVSLACSLFDTALDAGSSVKSALSETNYKLKAAGFPNVSYDMTKRILQKQGKLRRKT